MDVCIPTIGLHHILVPRTYTKFTIELDRGAKVSSTVHSKMKVDDSAF